MPNCGEHDLEVSCIGQWYNILHDGWKPQLIEMDIPQPDFLAGELEEKYGAGFRPMLQKDFITIMSVLKKTVLKTSPAATVAITYHSSQEGFIVNQIEEMCSACTPEGAYTLGCMWKYNKPRIGCTFAHPSYFLTYIVLCSSTMACAKHGTVHLILPSTKRSDPS